MLEVKTLGLRVGICRPFSFVALRLPLQLCLVPAFSAPQLAGRSVHSISSPALVEIPQVLSPRGRRRRVRNDTKPRSFPSLPRGRPSSVASRLSSRYRAAFRTRRGVVLRPCADDWRPRPVDWHMRHQAVVGCPVLMSRTSSFHAVSDNPVAFAPPPLATGISDGDLDFGALCALRSSRFTERRPCRSHRPQRMSIIAASRAATMAEQGYALRHGFSGMCS